jgi:hypothetical protein
MPEDGRPRQYQLIADQAVRNGSGNHHPGQCYDSCK